jgi:23S rRNA (uracil1939-C5)-methyltransferase
MRSSRPIRREPPALPETPVEGTIERLGSDGAGLLTLNGKLIAVPGALEGERVEIALTRSGTARLLRRYSDSPHRASPPCRHFGRCGGCTLQHLAPDLYASFKPRIIMDALARQGIRDVELRPIEISPPGSRRRATLEAKRDGNTIRLGFHEAASHSVVDLLECPILSPALTSLLPPLRSLLNTLLPARAAATITLGESDLGVDLGLKLPTPPDLPGLEVLAEFAESQDLARLWWQAQADAPMPIAERRRPSVRLGDIDVDLPPCAFRQATAGGERALTRAVIEAAGSAQHIADLFSGIGTFALPLLPGRRIHAVEQSADASDALAAAIRRAQRTGLTVERRDLFSRPLLPAELNRYDAVLFDPPRAGAAAQCEHLVQSTVPTVIAVSCNPASLARDAAILLKGPYRLEWVLPVDQFLWSNHVELVAVFRQGSGSKNR